MNSALLSLEDPSLVRLYAYWNEKRGARPFPSRRDIDPLDLGYILGWLILVDVGYEPLRFRFRLYGSNLVDQMRIDMTGQDLSEHPGPEYRNYIEQQWRNTVEKQHPTYSSFEGWLDDRRLRVAALRLPLSSDGRVIDMLLVAIRGLDLQPPR